MPRKKMLWMAKDSDGELWLYNGPLGVITLPCDDCGGNIKNFDTEGSEALRICNEVVPKLEKQLGKLRRGQAVQLEVSIFPYKATENEADERVEEDDDS